MYPKFLHCMQSRTYLESALSDGLMLTGHQITYAPTNNLNDFTELWDEFYPALCDRLRFLGLNWHTISENSRGNIRAGLGAGRGSVPMLCFTEVPEGRLLFDHYRIFGPYGLEIDKEWLVYNRADKVLYVGENSECTRRLHRIISEFHISRLHVDPEGTVIFDSSTLQSGLDLFAFIEKRENFQEAEWRIVGRSGFLGGGNDIGLRLPIDLSQIKTVLVRDEADVGIMEAMVEQLGEQRGISGLPPVRRQPNFL